MSRIAIIGANEHGRDVARLWGPSVVLYDDRRDAIESAVKEISGTTHSFRCTSEVDILEDCGVFLICETVHASMFNTDTSRLRLAAELIRNHAQPGGLIIVESPVAIGMTRELFGDITDMSVAFAIPDDPDKLPTDTAKVVGGLDPASAVIAGRFYAESGIYGSVIKVNRAEEVESAALMRTAWRAVNIAFANEMAKICGAHDVNLSVVSGLVDNAYYPWIGAGGPYIERDTSLILNRIRDTTLGTTGLLASAAKSLSERPREVLQCIVEKYCKRDGLDELYKKQFLVVGVGYKAGVADTENSPCMQVVNALRLEGAAVHCYDIYNKRYDEMPELRYKNGRMCYDGILVFHPYCLSQWEEFSSDIVTYFCRH